MFWAEKKFNHFYPLATWRKSQLLLSFQANVCFSEKALAQCQHATTRPLNRLRQTHLCRVSVFVVHCGYQRILDFLTVIAVVLIFYLSACDGAED